MSDRLASFVPFLVSVGWLAICLNQENIFINHLKADCNDQTLSKKSNLINFLPVHEMKYQKVEQCFENIQADGV